jgi:hypothetical protein
MKKRPKNGMDILIIWKDGEVSIFLYADGLLHYGDVCSDVWEEISKNIKQWAYVDKYFEKEIKQ